MFTRVRPALRVALQAIMKRLLSPHAMLTVTCGLYMVVGACIFQALEGHNLRSVKSERLNQIESSSDRYLDRLWELAHLPEYQDLSPQELKKIVRKRSKQQFNEYVDTVFAAHRTFRHGYENDAPSWDFLTSFFFTATMLTSIGYGYVAPFTFYGRLFGVVYCLIGIPLTLVTVANVAKFISEMVFRIHYELWKLWMRWKERKNQGLGIDEESKGLFGESEDEQEILDRVRLVRFPPIVVFMFVFLYGLFGAYIIHKNEEQWSYTESMYFTFISILTVGFGDYRPAATNLMTVLVVIMGGIILTTMCMDVVGRLYLKEIHYIGRKLKTNNPFYLIREAKARRRRRAMASLLAQLARGMIFAHRNYSDLALRKERKKERKRGSHVHGFMRMYSSYNVCLAQQHNGHFKRIMSVPDGQFMFARMPPDPPSDCQVVSTSAYSVRLRWAPAFSTDDQVTYNIRYRLKHTEDGKVRELRGIQGNTAEIMSIDSCSLYEFRITAVSRYGESKPVYLVQYTEPQLSPQHILATRLNANTIELVWEPPYKRTHEVKNYIVYFTDNPEASLSEWEKVTVNGRHVVFPDLKYDWFYMFSATACFRDGQRSPLSRALFIKTEKLQFNRQCVGHSKTIEVMESISDREDLSETTPLLRRDYVSFAV